MKSFPNFLQIDTLIEYTITKEKVTRKNIEQWNYNISTKYKPFYVKKKSIYYEVLGRPGGGQLLE